MHTADEEQLQRYTRTRDAEAFAELVRCYQGLVFATCRRGLYCQDDVDDAVQETFLRLARKAGEIRSNLGAWLYRCAVNVSADLNRQRQARRRREAAVGVAADAASPEQREVAELREQVDAALAKLEEEHRELIIQRYFVGRAMAELAKQEGVTPSAMTYRLERAVGALRTELEATGCVAGAVLAFLESEGQVQVMPTLTANVMKIGLKGVGAGVGAAGIGIAGKAAAVVVGILVVGGVWLAAQLAIGPEPGRAAATQPAGPVAMVQQPGPATAPTWVAAAPGAAPAVLSGFVLDEAGKPVAGAKVYLLGPASPAQPAVTDQNGRYAFPTLARDGDYDLLVAAKGYVRVGMGGPRQEEFIRLRLSTTAEARRDIVLERGATIVANVMDEQGNPIEQATVVMGTEASLPPVREDLFTSRRSGADGIAMETLPAEKTYCVAAVVPGRLAPAHQMVHLKKGSDVVDVNLVLKAGSLLRGVVTCSDGEPAVGYDVAIRPAWWKASTSPEWGKVRLSEKGEFALPASEGENHIYLWDQQRGMSIGTVQVPAQEVVHLKTRQPSKGALVSIRGEVRLVGKRPEMGVVAYASRPDGFDTRYASVEFGAGNPQVGRYEIKGLAPGEYMLWFSPAEAKSGKVGPVKAPGEAPLVELTVASKTRVGGQVVDAATGKPLNQFAVRVAWQDPAWTQVAHGEGRFSIDVPKAGEYQVQVSAAGYAWAWTERIRVGASEEAQVTVKMVAGGSLTGRVVDESGNPVHGAKVMTYSKARGERVRSRRRNVEVESITTNERGEFVWPHLAAGATQVEVVHPDFVAQVVDATVVDGQGTDVGTVLLMTGGSIEGTIRDAKGNPTAGVSVTIEDDSDRGVQVELKTDSEGRYQVDHLPPRRQNIRVLWPDMMSLQRAVRPLNGRSIQLDFASAPQVVSGRLLDGDAPVAKRYVRLSGKDWRAGHVEATTDTDANGGFIFRGIPQGRYLLASEPHVCRMVDVPVETMLKLGDIRADHGMVQLTLAADDAADIKGVVDIGAMHPDMGHFPIKTSAEGWRGDVAATEFQLRATYRIENGSLIYSIPSERKPGQKVVNAAMHLPRRSATLSIGAREDHESWEIPAWLESKDGSILAMTSLEGGRGKVLRLPPGTYYVRDIDTDKRNPSIPPIVLEAGKTTEVPAASVVTPRSVTVCVDVWTAQGLEAGVEPKLFDTNGNEIARDGRWIHRWAWNLRPGTYHARVAIDGKVSTREVVVTREVLVSERPMLDVDLVLPGDVAGKR